MTSAPDLLTCGWGSFSSKGGLFKKNIIRNNYLKKPLWNYQTPYEILHRCPLKTQSLWMYCASCRQDRLSVCSSTSCTPGALLSCSRQPVSPLLPWNFVSVRHHQRLRDVLLPDARDEQRSWKPNYQSNYDLIPFDSRSHHLTSPVLFLDS